jgi:hypothetical protein
LGSVLAKQGKIDQARSIFQQVVADAKSIGATTVCPAVMRDVRDELARLDANAVETDKLDPGTP